MNCDLETGIPDWIVEHPQTTGVFADLGLDVASGGKSLEYVCQHQGFSPPAVLEQLWGVVNRTAYRGAEAGQDN